MKRSTLSLLLALGVFFSLNAFAADKVTCFKMNFKNGKIKEKPKKECKRKWHATKEAAIAAAKEKCAKKGKRKNNWEWKDSDGKDGKGRCVKTKTRGGKMKYKLGNNVGSLGTDIFNLCFTKGFALEKGKKVEKLCYKAAKKYRKVATKNCKNEIKAERKKALAEMPAGLKKFASKIKNFFKKKKKDGVACKDVGKEALANHIKALEDAGDKFLYKKSKVSK